MTERPHPTATQGERSRYFDERPNMVTARDLNNFYMKVPGGGNRFTWVQLMSRFNAFPDEQTLREKEGGSSYVHLYSDKRLDQNEWEYYETIEKAFWDVVRKPEQILRINLKAYARRKNPDGPGLSATRLNKIRVAVENRILPLYHHLREQGYRHYDLIQ